MLGGNDWSLCTAVASKMYTWAHTELRRFLQSVLVTLTQHFGGSSDVVHAMQGVDQAL